jgi:hypothetical protein
VWLIYYLATVKNTLIEMLWLFKQFIYICLMKRGPQHLPWSQGLLRAAILAYFLTGVLQMLTKAPLEAVLPMMVVDVAVMLLYAWVCLKAFNYPARFVQMATAMAGTGTLFQLLAWPLMAYLDYQQDIPSPGTSILLVFIMGWNLAVYAHIFRESFNVQLLPAFVLTLAYTAIIVSVSQFLFPGVGV